MKRALFSLLTASASLLYAEELANPSMVSTQEAQPAYTSENAELEQSLQNLKSKAENGDTEAMLQVYQAYVRASLTAQAEAWFRRLLRQQEQLATNTNDGKILLLLGEQYMNGHEFLEPNEDKALALLRRAAELGEATAALKLGKYYSTLNPEESRSFYEKAYGIYKRAIADIHPGAELTPQQKEALTIMGDMELSGIGTEKNAQAAIAHLEQAHTGESLLRLYQIYTKGIEVPANLSKALLYAQQLVDCSKMDTSANINTDSLAWVLADYYLNGKEGIEKNTALGEKYLNIAEHNNYTPAVYYKALKLKEEDKSAEAFNCFIRLAHKDPNSMMHVALMLMYGAEGVEQDEARALGLLEELANRFGADNAWYSGRAPYEIALYYDRIGEPAEADVWYRVAAERNVIEAMARKGLNHITPGNEEEWSPTLMYKWWKLGSDAGDPTCSRYLNIFIWGIIPLTLIIVFGLPILIVHLLNKRAEKKENKQDPKA